MDDALLSPEDRMEALSRAYARAIAARAGYMTAEYDFDRDGVDLRISAGGAERPAIELQLKATTNLGAAGGGGFRFPLKVRNYNLLRLSALTPRLLVVLGLPQDEASWTTITERQLTLRRAAYWLNLRGAKETPNQSTITVYLPQANLFTVEALHDLMEQARRGRIA